MQGFTRTIYDNGYKYTMVYPPGWKQGDQRQPQVRKAPCVPAPSDPRIAEGSFFDRRPYCDRTTAADRQPRSTDARSRQPVIAYSGAEQRSQEGARDVRETEWSHSLRLYLSQAWLPEYVLGPQVDPSVRYEWPFLPVLVRVPRTRKLYMVQRIFDWDLHRATVTLKEVLGDVALTLTLIEQGKLRDLTLPDTVCRVLSEQDARFLDDCSFNTPSEVTELVQAYPLRTVIKMIKLFLSFKDDDKACAFLKFDKVNHLCPVQSADLFDLIAMPCGRPGELSLLVVVLPPWDIKEDDLEEFTRVGVPDGNLDLTNSASTFTSPSDILWAVIWDMCQKYKCRYFILTTYDQWVFGVLSSDTHRARVTTHLRAPVFPRDMSVSAKDVSQECFPVPSVLEMLLLWIFAAGDDDHVWWPLPSDMPVPLPSSELSISDVGRVGLGT